MRIRDKSTTTKAGRTLVFYKTNGTIDRMVNDEASVRVWNVMQDESDPLFFRKSAAGEVIINAMSKRISAPVFHPVPFQVKSNAYIGGVAWSSSFFGGPLCTLQWQFPGSKDIGQDNLLHISEELESLALTEAYAKVGKSDVEALVTLGELPETLAFLWSPIKKAIELTRRANRWQAYYNRVMSRYNRAMQRYLTLPAHIRARRRAPEVPTIHPFRWNGWEATDLASLWLAYRYGLMPLIYDIQAWSAMLNKTLNALGKTRRTARAGSQASRTFNYNTAPAGDNPRTHWENNLQAEFVVRAGVLYEPKFEFLQQLGLTLDRLPAAAYELIPLSFVADWFWNAASVYDALTAELRSMSVLGAWTSTTIRYHYTCSRFVDGGSDPNLTFVGGTGTCFSESGEYKSRTKRKLSDVELRLRVKLNTARIVDGLALISQLLGGRTRPIS